MTAKKYLEKIEKLDNAIQRKVERLSELEALLQKTTISMGDEKVYTSGSGADMTDLIVKKVMLQQEINDDIDGFVDYKNEAKRLMERLDNERHRKLLFYKYINYKSLYWIAKSQDLDYENVKHLHKRALVEFEKILHIDV